MRTRVKTQRITINSRRCHDPANFTGNVLHTIQIKVQQFNTRSIDVNNALHKQNNPQEETWSRKSTPADQLHIKQPPVTPSNDQ